MGAVDRVQQLPVDQAVQLPAGLVVLTLVRAELARGIRETSPNRGPEVDGYAPRCWRRGQWINVIGLAWCARFLSEMARRAGLDWLPCASVAELVAAARERGRWRDMTAGEAPKVGDWLVMGRGGQSPARGGIGHVAAIDEIVDGSWWTIGGNECDSIRRSWRTPDDVDEPPIGWISLP